MCEICLRRQSASYSLARRKTCARSVALSSVVDPTLAFPPCGSTPTENYCFATFILTSLRAHKFRLVAFFRHSRSSRLQIFRMQCGSLTRPGKDTALKARTCRVPSGSALELFRLLFLRLSWIRDPKDWTKLAEHLSQPVLPPDFTVPLSLTKLRFCQRLLLPQSAMDDKRLIWTFLLGTLVVLAKATMAEGGKKNSKYVGW